MRWPIFSGGRIRANIRVQDARQEQALLQYEKAVLLALEEVENALSAHDARARREESLRACGRRRTAAPWSSPRTATRAAWRASSPSSTRSGRYTRPRTGSVQSERERRGRPRRRLQVARWWLVGRAPVAPVVSSLRDAAAALEQARAAAAGRDVCMGGGVATIRQYLRAALIAVGFTHISESGSTRQAAFRTT